jgi:hypothetical protein
LDYFDRWDCVMTFGLARISVVRNVVSTAYAATAIVALASCSEATGAGSVRMQVHLQRVGAAGVSPQVNSLRPRMDVGSGITAAPHWSSDLNITSLKVPVFRIAIQSSDESVPTAELYHCQAATNNGCLVELTRTALQDLISAQPVTVHKGTYTRAFIQTCESSSYTSYITASVVLNGTTYYTQSNGTLSTTGPAQPLGLPYQGCGRNYNLPTPAVVADSAGAVIPFTMYFDIRDIAWAATGGNDVQNAWLPGGCSGSHPDNTNPQTFICTGYPDVSGIAGETAPVLERYRINGGATLGVFFTSGSDLPIGGFTRRYFTEGVTSNTGFGADTPVDTLSKNSNGTLRIATFGGGTSGASLSAPYFSAQAFQRANHTGAFMAIGVPGTYTAVKLP